MVRLLAGWRKNLAGRERAELKSEFVARRLSLVRLFGNEQSVDVNDDSGEEYLDRVAPDLAGEYRERLKEMAPEGRRRGRLMFYPTFFDRFGLEVINPHDRIAGAGKFPIYFETVPEKTDGRFALLYVPFDRVGKDEGETGRQAAEDLCRVAEGIACLFSEFGFGAKTSSGFGLAGEEVKEGTLQIKFPAGWPGAGEKPLKFRSFAELEREAQKLARVLQSGQAVVSNDD